MAEEPKPSQPLRRRERLTSRWGALKKDRSGYQSHWQDIANHLLPFAGRFTPTDRNRGGKRGQDILDNTGTMAHGILSSGLMAGATSPARPWFRLATLDPELNEAHNVRLWLYDATKRMMRVFQAGNTYRALHQCYEDLGAFGTSALFIRPDYENVIHLFPIPVGEFALAQDFKQRVNTFFREFEITVGQCVAEFGKDKCSHAVRNLWDRGELDSPVTIYHVIEPRADRDVTKADGRNMRWRSCYFESSGEPDALLREGGFERFPVLAPRWKVLSGEVYGNSPAMTALGDIRQLQHEQYRKGQAINYQTLPPVQAPPSMRNRDVDMQPGGITFVDSTAQNGGIRELWQTRLDLSHLRDDILDVRDRIRSAFYADLFLMLATSSDTTQRTAAEIAERHEEKLLVLGPVLERLQDELLSPLVDFTFDTMLGAGALPPAPPEMEGMELRVEFVSVLAQAQKLVGSVGNSRLVANAMQLAGAKPEVLDRIDVDGWFDAELDTSGADPRIAVPREKAAELRAARNKALAAKEQAAMLQQAGAATKDLATSPIDQPSALTAAMDQFTGYGGVS